MFQTLIFFPLWTRQMSLVLQQGSIIPRCLSPMLDGSYQLYFPSYPLISRVLQKIVSDSTTCVLITPWQQKQVWFLHLVHLSNYHRGASWVYQYIQISSPNRTDWFFTLIWDFTNWLSGGFGTDFFFHLKCYESYRVLGNLQLGMPTSLNGLDFLTSALQCLSTWGMYCYL